MDVIYSFIDTFNIPFLTAFLIGILTSISPCPLATNITAIAYISKDIKTTRNTLLNGLLYTLGRGISYTVLATLIYFGLSSFQISRIFQGWGDKVLGPVLIIIGLVMFGVININLGSKNEKLEKIKKNIAGKGYFGSLLLGMLFALAFCPFSAVLFFGMLIPLALKYSDGLLIPSVFSLATGLPVIIFAFILTFSVSKLGKVMHRVQTFEKYMRYIMALVFVIVGVYYTWRIWI